MKQSRKGAIKNPYLDPAVVAFLDQSYPEASPNPDDPDREVWMKAGERRLVRKLLHDLKRQENHVPD